MVVLLVQSSAIELVTNHKRSLVTLAVWTSSPIGGGGERIVILTHTRVTVEVLAVELIFHAQQSSTRSKQSVTKINLLGQCVSCRNYLLCLVNECSSLSCGFDLQPKYFWTSGITLLRNERSSVLNNKYCISKLVISSFTLTLFYPTFVWTFVFQEFNTICPVFINKDDD